MGEEGVKKTNKKGNNRLAKALVAIVGGLIAVILVVLLLNNGYNKKTETYTIKNARRGSEVTFNFAAEELGYEAKDSTDGIRFTNPEDKSTIIIRLYDVFKRDLIKPADAFPSTNYHDWSEIKFGGYEGYKILRTIDLVNRVEVALVLNLYDEEKGQVDGVTIMIEQSPTQPHEAEFDPVKFYESEDFRHIIETMKLTVAEELGE